MQADFPDIILASASSARASILFNAGLSFQQRSSALDEEAEHARHGVALGPERLAARLAELKARLVAAEEPDAVVIGADQVLAIGGNILKKPRTRDEARDQLLRLRGQLHHLYSAVVVLKDGNATAFNEVAALTMRDFSESFLDWYLDMVGNAVMTSVGAYHLESLGIQLFSKIEGDYFTILGLPILPVLGELRRLSILKT